MELAPIRGLFMDDVMDMELDSRERVSIRGLFMDDIIEVIFQYLSVYDLARCAQVCQHWKQFVQVVKRHRTPQITSYSLFGHHEDFEVDFSEYIRNLQSPPELLLVFTMCSKYRFQEGTRNSFARAVQKKINTDYFERLTQMSLLPKALICASHDASLSSLANRENGEDLTAIFFPTCPDINTRVVQLETNDSDAVRKCCTISNDTKLALVICDCMRSVQQERKVIQFLTEGNPNFVIAGIKVSNVHFEDTNHTKDRCYAVIVSGSGVQVASVIIPASMKNPGAIEEKLKGLKDAAIFSRDSFVLAFTCMTRNLCYFESENEEFRVFKKLYPSVPLFIVTGDRSGGIDYLPNISKPSKITSIFHAATTVFVILTVKTS